MERTLIELPR